MIEGFSGLDQERINELADLIPIKIAVVDEELTFVYVNTTFANWLGMEKDAVVGQQVSDILTRVAGEALRRDIVSGVIENDTTLDYIAEVYHPSGEVRWLSTRMVKSQNRPAVYCFMRDVTIEQTVAEDKIREEKLRQIQKMEAIGQLTGGIAHDFNNLLAIISGSLEMIERRMASGRAADCGKYISASKQAAGRAAQLTQQLLAFSRRQPLAPVPVDIADLVSRITPAIEQSVGPTTIVDIELDDVWMTSCDPNQLESSILHCIINSRDALPNGGIITVEMRNVGERESRSMDVASGEYVMLTISDDGTGMPPDVAERAFDPFYTTKPIGQGTGLGLSMLYGFVNQSNGSVKLQSQLGSGTTISILLPRYVEEEVVAEVDHSVKSTGQTILIVEDEELVRDLLTEVVESCGYATIQAEDADHAIPYISNKDQRIDLLLSDVGLPGMNGRQLAEIARDYRPELKVLFVTGFAPTATIRNSFLAEGMDMMTKPFEVDAVASKVNDMLS